MKKIKCLALLTALALTLVSPPQVANAATPVATVVLNNLCTAGSYSTKSVPVGTVIGSQTLCPHGHNAAHWYDAKTGISSKNGYAFERGNSSSVGIATVPKESTPPTVSLYETQIINNTGIDISFSLNPSYIAGYILSDDKVTVSWSSKTHAPIVIDGDRYDASHGNLSIDASRLIDGLTIRLGTTSGTISAMQNTNVTTSSHNATKCSIGGVVVTGEHKDVSSQGSSTKYYDDKGNVIGGSGYTSYKCSACGASWGGGGGSINKDYDGDVYDSSGNKVGYVGTGGSSGGNQIGLDLTYLKGGYSYSSGSSQSISNACYTATISTCDAHHYKGDHYYCSQHGYVGTSTKCKYSTSNNTYYEEAYGYSGNSPTFPAFRNTIKTDSTCTAHLGYLCTIPGHNVNVTVTKYPGSYRYTITDASGKVISTGTSSSSSFTFTMPPSNVTITIEQGQQDQTIVAALSATSIGYGGIPTLSTSNAKTTLSYTSSNPSVATISNSGVITVKGIGTTIITINAAETTDYKSASKTITLTVVKGNLSTKTAPKSESINYGQALSASTLSGGSVTNSSGSAVDGSWKWSSASSTIPKVGITQFVARFTPTDTTNYNY